jgi:NADH-quinone oxidoreductase subunit G
MAERLAGGERALVVLGQAAMSHGDAAVLRQLATYLASASGAAFNLLPHGGNPVGAWRAGAVPHRAAGVEAPGQNGLDAAAMLENSLGAYLLWGFEPEYDVENPTRAVAALSGADAVIAVSEFASGALLELADVILPLAPLAESEGSMFNFDGVNIRFAPAGRPSGNVRPGWKILRRLGAELGLDGFDQVTLEAIREEMNLALEGAHSRDEAPKLNAQARGDGLHRVGEVPHYSPDALCRRSTPLQGTVQADSYFVGLNPEDAKALELEDGEPAKVSQAGKDNSETGIPVRISDKVPVGAVWLRSATCGTRFLGAAMGAVEVGKG